MLMKDDSAELLILYSCPQSTLMGQPDANINLCHTLRGQAMLCMMVLMWGRAIPLPPSPALAPASRRPRDWPLWAPAHLHYILSWHAATLPSDCSDMPSSRKLMLAALWSFTVPGQYNGAVHDSICRQGQHRVASSQCFHEAVYVSSARATVKQRIGTSTLKPMVLNRSVP